MDGSEKDVTISGKLTDLNEFAYTVTGSKLTEQYLKAVRDYIDQKMDIPALTTYTGKTADPLVGYQIAVRLFTLRPEFWIYIKKYLQNLLLNMAIWILPRNMLWLSLKSNNRLKLKLPLQK